jgi:hypothetical protein
VLRIHQRKEVKILLRSHGPRAVARMTGISLSSVKRIAKEAEVFHLDDAAERKRRGIGRPSKVQRFRLSIAQILMQDPDIRSMEILRRVRMMGYPGGKSALYALVATLRAEQRARARDESERHAPTPATRAPTQSYGLR